MEEARLTITNFDELQSVLGTEYAAVKSAELIEYTGGNADLVTYSSKVGTKVLRGKIDMLGVTKEPVHPLHFDLITERGRVHFVQPEASSKIKVITD